MSKKKTVEPKFRRGMTFSQTKKPPINTVSTYKFNYTFKFYEKNYKKNSLDSRLKNKIQTAVSGTKQTVTTDKNKLIHRKLISNPLHFQQTTTAPTRRVNTRQNTTDQPTCSKTLDKPETSDTLCIYSRKEAHKPSNQERNEDWIKRKDQPRNNRGQFTSPTKNNDKETDMNLSIISDDDDFECYNKAEGKPVHTNIDDELQLLPKESNLTPEQGINIEKPKTLEPTRKSKRLPFAKQTKKLGRMPYQTNNKKKNVKNRKILQEKTTTTMDQSEKRNDRTLRENNEEIRTIRYNGPNKQTSTGPPRRGGCDILPSWPLP